MIFIFQRTMKLADIGPWFREDGVARSIKR
jgi:hypothetical protein